MTLFRAFALSLALACPVIAQASPAATPATAPNIDINPVFYGKWVGQLEYRDFQTNAQTFLPTWLTMTSNYNNNVITFDYIYDDGPTKTVRSRETLTLNETAATLTDEKTSETYSLSGMEEFRKARRGILTMTGQGKENNKPVDVRITITMRRNLFTWRKETRPAGTTEEFKFRDAYTFTRSEPPTF